MIRRYQTECINKIFSDDNKFRTWYLVELAYLRAYLAHADKKDPDLLKRLQHRVDTIDWKAFVLRVSDYEQEVRHDVIAFLQALEDELGEDARLIHLGLTSSDIVDTSGAFLLKAACKEIIARLDELIQIVFEKANLHRGVVCLGRTHGQAAEPTTFGIKLLTHLCEFIRCRKRLCEAMTGISVGKFSGAVGVYAHTDPMVENEALAILGLNAETVATQVVARDRYAEVFTSLAILAGSVERMATEIRLLMHGQLQEVFEPFNARQKGSSAMPHKKNPILSENLTGLMRLIRSYAQAALENQALWHERDIAHSSVERVIIPDAFSVMDFALTRLCGLIEHLVVDQERMLQNLRPYADVLHSQGVMLALVKKGLMRKEAYEIVQRASLAKNSKSFAQNLLDAGVDRRLKQEELMSCLTDNMAIRHEDILFERVKGLMNHIQPAQQ